MSDIPVPLPSDAALDVAALYALCEGASPPPWGLTEEDDCRVIGSDAHHVADCNRRTTTERDEANARFIAAARTALPAALRRLAAAEQQANRWYEAHTDVEAENVQLDRMLAAALARTAAAEAETARWRSEVVTLSTGPERNEDGTTDGADAAVVLAAVRACASAWMPTARLLGNVRAHDIVRALDETSQSLASALARTAALADALRELVEAMPQRSPGETVENFPWARDLAALDAARRVLAAEATP